MADLLTGALSPGSFSLYPHLGWLDLSAVYEKDELDQESVGGQEGRVQWCIGTVRQVCQGRDGGPVSLCVEHLEHCPLPASLSTMLSSLTPPSVSQGCCLVVSVCRLPVHLCPTSQAENLQRRTLFSFVSLVHGIMLSP